MRARRTGCLVVAAVLAGCAAPAERHREDWPWGRTRRGLQSRIVFEKHVYRQGEPIVCWVEVRNASDKPVLYDDRVGSNVEIAGPDGHEPPKIQGRFYSIMLPPKMVDIGERKAPPAYAYPTLKPHDVYRCGPDRLDDRRYFGQAGRYRLRWPGATPNPAVEASILDSLDELCGRSAQPKEQREAPADVRAFPPAADVTIEVVPAPGGGPDSGLLGRLIRAMPPEWAAYDPLLLKESVELPGHRPGRGSFLGLVHMPRSNYMMNVAFLWVWVMAEAAERDPKATQAPAEYLGRGKVGHVYIKPHVSDFGGPWPRWLHAAHDIAVALEVENPPPKPDGPDWGRLVCRILRECEVRGGSLASMCEYAKLTHGESELVKMEYVSNVAPAPMGSPPARKEPQWPYRDVLLVVRPAGSGRQAQAWDRVLEWRTKAGTKGEVCWRIASDDAPFARALRAVVDKEVRRFLR